MSCAFSPTRSHPRALIREGIFRFPILHGILDGRRVSVLHCYFLPRGRRRSRASWMRFVRLHRKIQRWFYCQWHSPYRPAPKKQGIPCFAWGQGSLRSAFRCQKEKWTRKHDFLFWAGTAMVKNRLKSCVDVRLDVFWWGSWEGGGSRGRVELGLRAGWVWKP